MSNKPFGQRFTDSPIFNVGAMFDIPSGEYIKDPKPTLTGSFIPRGGSFSLYSFTRTLQRMKEAPPSTVERYHFAYRALSMVGYIVEWDGTDKPPVVSWMDLEGFTDNEQVEAMIKDYLHKDYSEELLASKVAVSALVKDFTDSIKSTSQSGRNETMAYMDSFSHLSDK